MNGTRTDEGGGMDLLALLCGSLCKGTPLADSYGDNNINNNNAQPLTAPVQNGEQIAESTVVDAILWLVRLCSMLLYFTASYSGSVLLIFRS